MLNGRIEKILNFVKKPEICFILVAFIGGMMFSIFMPALQVPDELTHLRHMTSAYGTEKIYEELKYSFFECSSSPEVISNPDSIIDAEKYIDSGMKKFKTKVKITEFVINREFIRYLPAAIGFYFSVIIHLPILVCLQVGEIFSLLFYLFMGYLTIKTTPIKKWVFVFWMLAPMTLQQCASYNYDATLIPCCFFLTAYILKLFFSSGKIGWKNIILVGIITFCILLIKPPYILISGMIFIIPLEKFDLKIGNKLDLVKFIKKTRWILIIFGIVGICALMYLFRDNVFIKLLYVAIRKPNEMYRLFIGSCTELNSYYVNSLVGAFGWLDSKVNSFFVVFFFMIFIYIFMRDGDELYNSEIELTKINRLWVILLTVVMTSFIFIALLTWSFQVYNMDEDVSYIEYFSYIKQLTRFDGVQSRYFIPYIPMLCISVKSKNKVINRYDYYLIQYCFYFISLFYVLYILYNRYWI